MYAKVETRWSAIDPFLGTATDQVIATRFGRQNNTVAHRRESLGIAPYRLHVKPTAEAWREHYEAKFGRERISLIGVVTDTVVSETLGVSRERVRQMREKLERPRPPYIRKALLNPRPSKFPWNEIDLLLGTQTDVKLAELFTCNKATIANRRDSKEISPYRAIDWRPIDPFVGTDYDSVIARRFGLKAKTVAAHRRYALLRPSFSGKHGLQKWKRPKHGGHERSKGPGMKKKRRRKSESLRKWEELTKQVDLLRKQHRAGLSETRTKNSGDTVAVDYFALDDVLDYFDKEHDVLERLMRCHEILDEYL